MLIRDMQAGDMDSLAELYREFWNERSNVDKMKVTFESLRTNDAYILLGAIRDLQLVGSVMGIVCDELYGECSRFLVVENMVVDRNDRKAGVGRALFFELESRAKSLGCSQVILVTERSRTDACAFYESIGFHPDANTGYKKKL